MCQPYQYSVQLFCMWGWVLEDLLYVKQSALELHTPFNKAPKNNSEKPCCPGTASRAPWTEKYTYLLAFF